MPEKHVNLGAQFRSDSPNDQPDVVEQESVRTTIVGGRPPGSGKPLGPLPRGIEILLKKASVDGEFKTLLLNDPESAARSIELVLDPVEQAMLRHIPGQQLAMVIEQTVVPEPQRRAFLGQAASLMIAVLGGMSLTGCGERASRGIRPENRGVPAGIQPGTTDIEPVEPFPAPAGVRPDLSDENETSETPIEIADPPIVTESRPDLP